MKSIVGTEPVAEAMKDLAHPERMRMFAALHRQPLSRLELLREMHDISATTLFRHLNRMVDAGLVEIVGERQVGPNVERIYEAVPLDLPSDESARLSADDYVAIVTALAADLITTVQAVGRSRKGLHRRSTFGMQMFFASDAEYLGIQDRFDAFLAELDREFPPGPARSARALSYGICPRQP